MSLLRLVIIGALLGSCATADKAPVPKPTRELASGAAQIRGGGIRMDVQIGRGLTNKVGSIGRIRVSPHATVTP